MATVEFPTHGSLEILMDLNFIHPLETLENWIETGPQFTLGNKISTLAKPVMLGVVHGFVTQMDGTSTVLIWSNDTDRYVQLRPDQIQLGHAAPLVLTPLMPPQGLPSAGTCLSGCTLLANFLRGIPMREVCPGTLLINAKGKPVRVTNVYFSRESTVMVQISAHCHATITHPLIDTKAHGRMQRNRRHSSKIVTTAAEWHSRRNTDNYRFPPPGDPPTRFKPHIDHPLHPSSPQNLRKSDDMWGFSTEQNQAVQSFDYSSCLICPIGHIGWAQVNTDQAILSCWGRTRHLPDPWPDLDEFQDQIEAIHTFLSNPKAIRKLETKHVMSQNPHSAAPSQSWKGKQLIEFTDGHVQLEWDHGRWFVHNWKTTESFPLGRAWIQPEENLL